MTNEESIKELAQHMLAYLRENTEFDYILEETLTQEVPDKYTLRIYSGHACVDMVALYDIRDVIRTLAIEINRYGLG